MRSGIHAAALAAVFFGLMWVLLRSEPMPIGVGPGGGLVEYDDATALLCQKAMPIIFWPHWVLPTRLLLAAPGLFGLIIVAIDTIAIVAAFSLPIHLLIRAIRRNY
jgi:hypothetical protein